MASCPFQSVLGSVVPAFENHQLTEPAETRW